jgi:predicted ATPase
VLEGADLVTEIIQAAPAVKILVTSQERLNVAEEWLLDLQGLAYPGKGSQQAGEYDAVKLFTELTQKVNPRFQLSDDEAPHVAKICRLMGGLPLGIELASSWTRVLPTREIAQEIEKDLDFLSGLPARSLPERHRSLRAVFEYTWRLLTDTERDALRKLTVFHGGFKARAAIFVAGAPLSLLLALADKSLLQRFADERFAIPDVLRQYAHQKFEADLESALKDEVFARHCEYYCAALEEREPELLSDSQAEVLSDISIDLENVRQAWEWATSRRDVGSLERSMEAVYRYYQTRSLFHEGEQLFRKIVTMCRDDGMEGPTLGRALSRQGRLLLRMSQIETSKEILEESVLILKRFDIRRDLASTLSVLAVIAEAEGDYERSVAMQERSLKLFNEVSDRKGVAAVHLRLGNVGFATGDYSMARLRYQTSNQLYRELGDQRGMAMCLNNLGSIADTLGEYREARRLFRESLAIKRDLGDRRGVAYTMNNLGFVSYLLGDYDQAEAQLSECLAIFREIGDRRGIAFALVNLGNVAYGRGEYFASEAAYLESLQQCEEIGYRVGCAYALNCLGNVSRQTNRPSEARAYHERALDHAVAVQAVPAILEILVDASPLLLEDGHDNLAMAVLRLVHTHPSSRFEVRERAAVMLAEYETGKEVVEPSGISLQDAATAALRSLAVVS